MKQWKNMTSNKKIILGIIGKNSSGKTTATEYLKNKYNAVSFRFSDALKDVLIRLHLENSRANFQNISTILRQNFSEDILAKIIAEDVKNCSAEIIITEGVRRPADIIYLTQIPNFHLLAIKTDQKIRYQRTKNRTEKTDDQQKTWEEFLAEDGQETEQKIDEIAQQAEFQVDNNDTLEKLYKQLDELIKKIK